MGKPFLLHTGASFRRDNPDEYQAVSNIFGNQGSGELIHDIPVGSIVIPRFRMLPFGELVEKEVKAHGSTLVNSWVQHRNIADLFNWVGLLEGLTAPAYRGDSITRLGEGEWFVKGSTNSIKNRWFDCCYAATTEDLGRVVRNNLLDVYVGGQDIVVRPYQKFRQIGEAVDGRPVFNEKRCFVLFGEVISVADYWSSLPEFRTPVLNRVLFDATLRETVERTKHLANFYVIDMAENEDGSWQVVELNDAVMSGLSDNNPARVWRKVYDRLADL